MPRPSRLTKNHLYDEREAAAALGITLARLYELLDQHIFTDANPRPQCLHFTSDDLLLLGYWCNAPRRGKPEVITMPKRK
jgi:hypothetical protein